MQVQITIVADLTQNQFNVNGPFEKPAMFLSILDAVKNAVVQRCVQNELNAGPGLVLANRLPPANGAAH